MLRSVFCVFALTACGGSDPAMVDAAPADDAAPATVMSAACANPAAMVESTGGFRFAPQGVTINVGQQVQFTNPISHSVVPATSGNTDSGLRAPANATTCLVFTAPGVFNYKCSPHSSMTGTVTVN